MPSMKISNELAHAVWNTQRIPKGIHPINTYIMNASVAIIFSLTKVAKFNLER